MRQVEVGTGANADISDAGVDEIANPLTTDFPERAALTAAASTGLDDQVETMTLIRSMATPGRSATAVAAASTDDPAPASSYSAMRFVRFSFSGPAIHADAQHAASEQVKKPTARLRGHILGDFNCGGQQENDATTAAEPIGS